ncbi:MAG: DegV family protein [Chloroflexota bacterium]|nr:DegV family protein [Chloroflexota bacterium]
MGKVSIVTDSLADIPAGLVEKYNIHVIPILVMFGQETFRDGVDITPEEFYRRFRESDELPTTAVPSMIEFVKLYQKLGQEADGIVSIHISEHLSATVETAKVASKELPEIPIRVIDAHSTTMAQGFVALEAAKVAAAGGDLKKVAARAEEMIPKVHVMAMVPTLKYLHRTGRIGRAEYLAGSLLKINPILHIARDGIVEALEKPRTKAKALKRLLEMTEEMIGSNPAHIAVVHADALDEAERLRKKVDSRFNCVELFITEFTPVLGTHTGPGVVGLAFWAETPEVS